MSGSTDDNNLRAELLMMLEPHFPGISVEIAHSKRWNRKTLTFRWVAFTDLLPEERFERLTRVLKEDYRRERLPGFLWLELAADESIDDFLKLPRSEDVTEHEHELYRRLLDVGFFDRLDKTLGARPKRKCGGDFSAAREVLKKAKADKETIQNAKLVFIRHGVYCDCQVLASAKPALEKLYAGAA